MILHEAGKTNPTSQTVNCGLNLEAHKRMNSQSELPNEFDLKTSRDQQEQVHITSKCQERRMESGNET